MLKKGRDKYLVITAGRCTNQALIKVLLLEDLSDGWNPLQTNTSITSNSVNDHDLPLLDEAASQKVEMARKWQKIAVGS